jgi:hypothetical protein
MTVIDAVKQRFQERYGISVEQFAANPDLAKSISELRRPYNKPYIPENSNGVSAREADKRNLAILTKW